MKASPNAWPVLFAVALAGCDGATLDLEFSSRQPVALRRLDVEVDGQRLRFADAGTYALPQSLRLLVNAGPLTLTARGVDLSGGAHEHTADLQLVAGETRKREVDLTDVRWCPAPEPAADEVVLFDEGVHGTAFGYDGARLSEPVDAAEACSGTHLLAYAARGRYDGMGIITSSARRVARVELRLRSTPASSWVVGLGDGPTWLPTADAPLLLDAAWRSFSLDVPDDAPPGSRLVLQLDSAEPALLHVDDVRLTPRE